MSRIVPKLNLNKTPQLVENNSLVMAKNIRLLEDGTIGPDTSLKEVITKTGDVHTNTIHHDAITQQLVEYQYTILDVDTTINYQRESISPDENNLEDVAFDFVNYLPPNVMHLVDEDKYVKINSDINCTIYCYTFNGIEPEWTREQFTYNPNEQLLLNNNGYCFALAIRQDIWDEDEQHPTGIVDYYYCIVPKHLLNHTTEIRKYNYFLVSPIYPTSEIETIVISEAWDEVVTTTDTPRYLGQIVGLDNKIYFFVEELAIQYSQEAHDEILEKYPNECFIGDKPLDNQEVTFDVNDDNYVTRRRLLFEDREIAEAILPVYNDRIKIYEYDEVAETFTRVKCAWRYSGGKINGCVFKNNTGHTILTICEYDVPNGIQVPIKHIDLNICKLSDNESIYTQNPNIPITNLILTGTYPKEIRAGVYQFFIRYKIHDNRYTSWFPCSKECFTGSKKTIATNQGELKYIDKHTNSDTSFIFSVEHLFPAYCNIYKKFQIGFILSQDDGAIVAREWKEFDFGITTIYFDLLVDDIKDANIDDLLETTYEIFNVENCVNYKNKLYIANYEETDFNPQLQSLARQIQISICAHNIGSAANKYYFNDELLISSQNNNNFDYIGNTNNLFKDIWSCSPYFDVSSEELNDDATGTYTQIPLEGIIHHHVSDSNVLSTDSLECHPQSIDDDTLDSDGCPVNAWMNSQHDYSYNKAYVLAIYIEYNGNYINIFDDYRYTYLDAYHSDTESILHTNNIESHVVGACDLKIKDKIVYYNINDNNWYIEINNNYYPISEYYIAYSVIDSAPGSQHFIKQGNNYTRVDGTVYTPNFWVKYTKKTTFIKKRKVYFNTFYITQTITNTKEYPTLLPFTGYNFYIHYVKANGVITNGYLINNTPVKLNSYCKDDVGTTYNVGNVSYYTPGTPITTQDEDDIIIYPYFDDIIKPPGYVGCFISVAIVNNNVCQLFNVDPPIENDKRFHYKADCLELDTLCYTKFKNLRIFASDGNEITEQDHYGEYFDSGNTEDITYFGECGSVVWDTATAVNTIQNVTDDVFWLVMETNEVARRLIKFTPFIKLNSTYAYYDNYEHLNNIGFVCFVKKLKKSIYGTSIYINDDDVYIMQKDNNISGSTNGKIKLLETLNEQYFRLMRDNKLNRIKSNFNLNYLNLSEDIIPKYKTIDSSATPPDVRFVCMINSITSSFIYQFSSWYKDYTRKYYDIFDDKKITRFDNTIRSSIVIGDEEYNTFKFNSTDYYNVPTLRGIITNLISIANSIYVHCEHSLFKFSDNKTLNAQDEEVTLQENDIFNSGITEIFDAQYGYAGLKKREQSLITYNAYVFYDEVAKTIYAFGGEQQIGNISEPIKKLIKAINPTDVQFLGDEPHNRFFVNFRNNNGNVCLSFNFNTKSFISVHDFDFKFGFHSRRNSYLVNDILYNVTTPLGWIIYKIVDTIKTQNRRTDTSTPDYEQTDFNINYIAYQACYKTSLIHIPDCDDAIIFNEVKSANACVDIICNTEYEAIKVLNYISWICSEIQQYGQGQNNVGEEIIDRHYPAHKIRIYSDTTETSLFELLDANGNPKIANENSQYFDNAHQRANSRTWQYPQYNCGVWSMNYFRDVKNIEDVFDYKNPDNEIIGETGHETSVDLTPKITRQNLTQENSLLYGKYFVVRFIFNNKNFKLENVILRMNDYGKTK